MRLKGYSVKHQHYFYCTLYIDINKISVLNIALIFTVFGVKEIDASFSTRNFRLFHLLPTKQF